MRSILLITAAVVAVSVYLGLPGSAGAQTFYPTYSTPVVTTWRTVSPAPTVIPTPMIVDRPVTVLESSPIRSSVPMNQAVLEFDRPFSETIYTGPVTRLSVPDTETIVSERIVTVAPSEPVPLLSVDRNLLPLLPRQLPLREAKAAGLASDETVAETKQEIVTDGKPVESADTIRDLVLTEQAPKLLSEKAENENIFKDIMIPRDIPVRTTVSKPPRTLPPPGSTSIPTPPRPVVDLPDAEPVPQAVLQPPPQSLIPPLILGQNVSRNPVEDILRDPPPHPEGPIDPGELDPKLTDASTVVPLPFDMADGGSSSLSNGKPRSPKPSEVKGEQWVSGALLLTTIIASMVACYAVVLAFEFRQRWLQSVTEQNSRYSTGVFSDGSYLDGMESYGGTSSYGNSSDGLLSGRYGGEILEPSLRY